jgi:hypothetical protein
MRSKRFRRTRWCCRRTACRFAEFRGIANCAHHAARLQELATALASAGAPQSAADIVPVLFRRPLDLQQRFFAMGEAIAHLNHLWRSGRATRVAGSGTIRFTA